MARVTFERKDFGQTRIAHWQQWVGKKFALQNGWASKVLSVAGHRQNYYRQIQRHRKMHHAGCSNSIEKLTYGQITLWKPLCNRQVIGKRPFFKEKEGKMALSRETKVKKADSSVKKDWCSLILQRKICIHFVHRECPVLGSGVLSSTALYSCQQQTAAEPMLVLSSSESRTRGIFKQILMLHTLSFILEQQKL